MAINVPCGDNVIVGTFNVCVDGLDLGATASTLTISFSRTYEDIRSGQTRSLLKRFMTEQTITVTVDLLEPTIDKMRIIYGQEDTMNAGFTTLCFVDSGGCSFPEEFALTIAGPGPACGCRNWYFPRVQITPTQIDYVVSTDTATTQTVEFSVIPECPSGNLGCVTDVCDMIATDKDTLVALVCTPDSVIPAFA